MNAFVKNFDKSNQYINLLVYDKKLLKRQNEIWDKIKSLFKKKLDNEPMYNDKYIKMPRENERFTCLSVILIDFVTNVDKKYYPQVFLRERKYAGRKKRIMSTIKEELKLDESDSESDNEFDMYQKICDGLNQVIIVL